MSILNCSTELYKKRLKFRFAIFIAVPIATIILNLLLTFLRSDATSTAFLAINIVADILCLWFMLAFYAFGISLRRHMLTLAEADEGLTQTISGKVEEISETSQVVERLACLQVSLISGEETRKVFIAERGAVRLERGRSYKIKTYNNIVIEAVGDES